MRRFRFLIPLSALLLVGLIVVELLLATSMPAHAAPPLALNTPPQVGLPVRYQGDVNLVLAAVISEDNGDGTWDLQYAAPSGVWVPVMSRVQGPPGAPGTFHLLR